ncbi:dCTP deaminase [Chelatococcus sp.]|uniref:dCTP deaminase n=1 Tax=Chelatococcus sp. TaxID=1953771 RepID=UPI00341ED3DA
MPDGAASVDLRLGRWFLAIQQSRTSQINLSQTRDADHFEAEEGRMYYVPFGERFVVHPGRFVLAATLEWIRVPPTLGGYITGKSTTGRRGLVIETAAGLHPGFSGCITLELSNCGEVPIALVPGMRICQIFFHEVRGSSGNNKTSVGGRRKPTFGPYVLDSFVRRAMERKDSTALQSDLFRE